MKLLSKALVLVALCSSFVTGQELTSKEKLQKIDELQSQIKTLEKEILAPGKKDLKAAQSENLEVFRIMPREIYGRKLNIEGGGAYYSFTSGSHDYQKIAQISLEQNKIKVGFAGADYGFIADLGEINLASVTRETTEANFLANYKPPTGETEVRIEQRRAANYEVNGLVYKNSLPAVVGHSYVLRAISFRDADVLVAFKIHRQDADGSLIVFWKMLENFEKPLFAQK